MKTLLTIITLSLGICHSSATDNLFQLVREKLGDNPAFVAGLDEAEEYVNIVQSNPNRDETHPMLQTVLKNVSGAVEEKTGKKLPEQPVPTWNTIIFDLLEPLKTLPTTFIDPTDRVLRDPKYPGIELKDADPEYSGLESDYMRSNPPLYQCPVFSDTVPDGLLGYATLILATAKRVWLSGIILEDFRTLGENRSITGFLIHDALAHNRTLLLLTPKLAQWIDNGNFLKFVQRLVDEAESTDELKTNFMYLFYLFHERNNFGMSMDAPHEINIRNAGPREPWQELKPLCVAYSKLMATYGKFFLDGDVIDTTLPIDQEAFTNWLLSIDRSNPLTTEYYNVSIADLKRKFPAK